MKFPLPRGVSELTELFDAQTIEVSPVGTANAKAHRLDPTCSTHTDDVVSAGGEARGKLNYWLSLAHRHDAETAARIIVAHSTGPAWARGFIMCSPQYGDWMLYTISVSASILRCLLFQPSGKAKIICSALICVIEFPIFGELCLDYSTSRRRWPVIYLTVYLASVGWLYGWMGSDSLEGSSSNSQYMLAMWLIISWPVIVSESVNLNAPTENRGSNRLAVAGALGAALASLGCGVLSDSDAGVLELLKVEGGERPKSCASSVATPLADKKWDRGCNVAHILDYFGSCLTAQEERVVAGHIEAAIDRERTCYPALDRRARRTMYCEVDDYSVNCRLTPMIIPVQEVMEPRGPITVEEVKRWCDYSQLVDYVSAGLPGYVYAGDVTILFTWVGWVLGVGIATKSLEAPLVMANAGSGYLYSETYHRLLAIQSSLPGARVSCLKRLIAIPFTVTACVTLGCISRMAVADTAMWTHVISLVVGVYVTSLNPYGLGAKVSQGVLEIATPEGGQCHYKKTPTTVGRFRVVGRCADEQSDVVDYTKERGEQSTSVVCMGGPDHSRTEKKTKPGTGCSPWRSDRVSHIHTTLFTNPSPYNAVVEAIACKSREERMHFQEGQQAQEEQQAAALSLANGSPPVQLPQVSQDDPMQEDERPAALPPPPATDAEGTARAGPTLALSEEGEGNVPEAPRYYYRTSAKAQPIIDSSKFVATWWSLAISSKEMNGDVPLYWFTVVADFAGVAEKSAFALERGDKKQNLHIQGMVLLHTYDTDATAARKLRTAVRADLVLEQGHLQFKAFRGSQKFFEMLGYLSKDKDKPHFQLVLNNIEKHVMSRAAKQREAAQPKAWADGYTIIHKSHVFNVLFGQYMKHLYPLQMHMVTVAFFFVGACHGRELMWEPNSMAGSSQGRPFDNVRSKAMWRLRVMPDYAAPEEMWTLNCKILYYDRFTHDAMVKLMEGELRWLRLSLHEVKSFAHNVKLIMDGLARGKVCLAAGETAATLSPERA
ncbi:unnamed protein product [Chrysoparadoxa australica]